MLDTGIYTGKQIEIAARDLQDAAGSPEQAKGLPLEKIFSTEAAINILSPEVRILRERGFSNARIADLLTGFDIEVTEADVVRFYLPEPDNEELVA